jgi:hypothetical protein
MASFMITSLTPNTLLSGKIKETYGADSLALTAYCWLVSAKGVTVQEVCQKLDIGAAENPGAMGHVVAVRIENYFGFGPAHVWEWLKARGTSD